MLVLASAGRAKPRLEVAPGISGVVRSRAEDRRAAGAISGARLTFRAVPGDDVVEATSGFLGRYAVDLPPGTWVGEISAPGHQAATLLPGDLRTHRGSRSMRNFFLWPTHVLRDLPREGRFRAPPSPPVEWRLGLQREEPEAGPVAVGMPVRLRASARDHAGVEFVRPMCDGCPLVAWPGDLECGGFPGCVETFELTFTGPGRWVVLVNARARDSARGPNRWLNAGEGLPFVVVDVVDPRAPPPPRSPPGSWLR